MGVGFGLSAWWGIGLGSVVLGLMFWSGLIEFGFIGGGLQVLGWALGLGLKNTENHTGWAFTQLMDRICQFS